MVSKKAMPPKGVGGGTTTSSLPADVLENIKRDLAKRKLCAEAAFLKTNKLLTLKNNSKGPKFLLMRHSKHCEGITMANVSPFLVETAVTGTAGEEMEVKLLRDGSVLIQTKNVQQAQKLIKLTGLSSTIPITVTEHEKLNSSKGVIMCRMLNTCTEEEILGNLKNQGVTEIYAVKKTIEGFLKPTGTYFLTFSTTKIPEEIKIAYLNVKVNPYVPEPTRCFNCLQYGHISKNCPKKEERLCINCSDPHHTEDEEKCSRPSKCIHCPGKHNSISRDCPKYIQQKTILKIKVTDCVSFPEAARIYRNTNPTLLIQKPTFSSLLQTKTCNCACTCQQPPPLATDSTNKQQPNKNKHDGSTASSDQIPTKMKRNETDDNNQEAGPSDPSGSHCN